MVRHEKNTIVESKACDIMAEERIIVEPYY